MPEQTDGFSVEASLGVGLYAEQPLLLYYYNTIPSSRFTCKEDYLSDHDPCSLSAWSNGKVQWSLPGA